MEEPEIEVGREFREHQSKLFYYTIALCVACIGFSVYTTLGKPLNRSQLPLGLAVFCWSVSIYCGISFLGYVLSNLWANYNYFKIIRGEDPEVGNNPSNIKAALEGIKKATQTNAKRGFSMASWHTRLFYIGMILFLIWHIRQMYLNK